MYTCNTFIIQATVATIVNYDRNKFIHLNHTQTRGKSYWRARLSTVDLFVLTSFDQLLFILKILFTFFTKQATLTRTSTVLSPPPQLVFLAQTQLTLWLGQNKTNIMRLNWYYYTSCKFFSVRNAPAYSSRVKILRQKRKTKANDISLCKANFLSL